MEIKDKYLSFEVIGSGKIYNNAGAKGEKFKIITLSAEEIAIRTAANFNAGDSVTLKVQIKAFYFEFDINSVGRIIEKSTLGNESKYTIEFIGMTNIDKKEIDEYLRSNFGFVD